MIPLRLTIHNFLCYRDNVPPVDFSGIHLACISGDNGHGKSALLDAITWALWGKARAKTDDELIHLGQSEMEIEFEFLLGEARYRILRKRSKPRASLGGTRPGQSILDFQLWDGDHFRSVAGNTIRDTERKIVDTLRMDYETFINSAFLLQGRADEFTNKMPSERKRILADILGLGLYDDLADRAREKAKDRARTQIELEKAMAEIDAELAKRPVYEDEARGAQAEASALADKARVKEGEVQHLRQRKHSLDLKAASLAELEVRLAHGQKELAETRQQIEHRQARINEYEKVISERERVETGYSALQEARQAEEEMGRKLGTLLKLNEEKNRLERLIESEKNRLLAELRFQDEKARELQDKVSQLSCLEQQLAEARQALVGYDRLEAEREQLRAQVQCIQEQLAALRIENKRLKSDMLALKEKIDLLAGVSNCPLCETPLSNVERERIRVKYQAEGTQKGQSYRQNAAKARQLESELQGLLKKASELEGKLKGKGEAQRQEAIWERNLAETRQARDDLGALAESRASLGRTLEEESYARETWSQLAGLQLKESRLGYSATSHEEARNRLKEYEGFEAAKGSLDAALRYLDEEKNTLERLKAAALRWLESLSEDQARRETLQQELMGLPAVNSELAARQRELEEVQGQASRAQMLLGAARQKLAHCDFLADQRREKEEHWRLASAEREAYEKLATAFGKNGIQAMIIETVTPEIEEEANRLLGRMTDNRMHVKLETQRDTKKGNTIETLDIRIADELGTRNYELFSGGEAFRANFALRIALSKLLARRAGARLSTLVMDEGFGTQDSQGRERLVEAIRSIQDDFERVLVITHIQELKDTFPVHIEVTKTQEGSQIVVS